MARNAAEERERRTWRKDHRKRGSVADWASVDAQNFLRQLARVTARGMAIRCGYTRDGGAFAIGIYGDGDEAYTEIVGPSDDPAMLLAELADYYDKDSDATHKA